MKLNVTKKLASLFLSVLLTFGSLFSIKCFAELNDIGIIGGSYKNVVDAKIEYKQQHPEDQTKYECHHLIAKEALNRWKDEIVRRGLANRYNEFLNDPYQNWAPSITMEKADHEQTRSYYNEHTRTKRQNQDASDYINWQADGIIKYGDIIGVLKEECEFIRETFGHKYDKALEQVWTYIKLLKYQRTEDPYHHCRCLKINNPYNENWALYYPL